MSQADPDFNRGWTYRLPGDCFHEQVQFFRSIEKMVSHVLTRLKNTVLPKFLRAREMGREEPGYDPEVWASIWEWAKDSHLVREDDLLPLQTQDAACMAKSMGKNYLARSTSPPQPPMADDGRDCRTGPSTTAHNIELVETETNYADDLADDSSAGSLFKSITYLGDRQSLFADDDDPALVFGLGAVAPIVLTTLNSWAESEPAEGPLRWVIQDFPSIYDRLDMDGLEKMTAKMNLPLFRELIESENLLTPDPPPYVYTFKPVKAWDVRKEVRTDAEDRIMDELRTQVKQHMEENERNARLLQFERSPIKGNREHYDWLVRYQVEGMRYADVFQTVKKEKPELSENTVRYGIRAAAELIIGVEWKRWLRPGKSGRPRRS
jgi:hypothetical protein